jgi:SPP1 family predicted phage head-tail adaptor
MQTLAAGRLRHQCTFLVQGQLIPVSMTAGSAAIAGSAFLPTDVGLPLIVPGAGAAIAVPFPAPPAPPVIPPVPPAPVVIPPSAALVTSVLAVDASGNGTAADPALTTVTGAIAMLGRAAFDATGSPLPLLDGATTWAEVVFVSGKEQYGGDTFVAEATHRITMRYQAGVLPQWQVRLGAAGGTIFRILYVDNVEQRNVQLDLYCVVLDGVS